MLHVMAYLMRDHIGLSKISRRVEPPAQLFIERQVDIDLLVTGTIKRTNSGARPATSRINAIRKKHERWLSILTSILLKQVVPNVFRLSEHHRYKVLQLFLFRIKWPRALHLRRRFARQLFEQLP